VTDASHALIPSQDLTELLGQVRDCSICEAHLPLGPRPVVQIDPNARLLIIGQAPGTRVHNTGVPWNDPSGDRLRKWLEMDREVFYDPRKVAIMPMGFCYPGKGKSGDLPPRKECAPQWHDALLSRMPNIELTLLIGQYAQAYYLSADDSERAGNYRTLTERVMDWQAFTPKFLPLPHPSPRNLRWFKNNPWFESEVVPWLRQQTQSLLVK
jgi:uracil-DNA glycosylase